MLKHISAIAVDFGSTNSGCARIISHDMNGELCYATPEYLHTGVNNYAKDNTWFFVNPLFLTRICNSYETLIDSDFRILSAVFNNTENPNIIWTRRAIELNAAKLVTEGWVPFARFKMMLYKGQDTYDALNYPLPLIIKTFLRILKIECLHLESRRMGRTVNADEIAWGLTIPSIWTDDNKRVMVDIARNVFNNTTRILSEPEGPLVSNLLHSSDDGRVRYEDGRVSLVIDMGGGTTDMCLMREVQQADGRFQLEMIAETDGSAAGGNDIDNAFILYMLRYISKGKTSEAGISYDNLSDDDLSDMLYIGFMSNIANYIKFEDNWYELKATNGSVSFNFTKEYRKWLYDNGYTDVCI